MVSNIACDVHPLNNLRVLHYLRDDLGADQTQIDQWYAQWINSGFHSIEKLLAQGDGHFCFGDKPGMADCYLIPQVFNALRFRVSIDQYPAISSVYNHCNTLSSFQKAHPDQQPDKPES
jgi:maleylacetoacetate isomerase/maleylpyruvate isomerase